MAPPLLRLKVSGMGDTLAPFIRRGEIDETATRQSTNRAVFAMRQVAAKQTSKKFAIKAGRVKRYTRLAKYSRRGKAAAITLFDSFIRTQDLAADVKIERRTSAGRRTRRVSVVRVTYERARGRMAVNNENFPDYVDRPGFTLTQRSRGKLKPGQAIFERTGLARLPLTRVAFPVFPKHYRDRELVPAMQSKGREVAAREYARVFARLANRKRARGLGAELSQLKK